MSAIEIAGLTTADLAAIVEIEVARFDEPWSLGMLEDELASPTRRYTKATLDSVLAGYLGLMAVDHEGHVNTIATTTAAEGRGVATALLVDGLRALIARGVRDVTLEVAARNDRAQRLYGRFGFASVGVRRRYYERSGDDAIVMWVRDVDTPDYAARLASLERA